MSEATATPETPVAAAPAIQKFVQPLAGTYHVRADIPKDIVQAKFDEYWESQKDRLDQNLVKKAMRGYRQLNRNRVVMAAGGENHFYKTALLELLSDQFADLYNEPWSYLQMASTLNADTGMYRIEGVAYTEPKVELNLEGFEERVQLEPLNDEIIVKTVARRLDAIREEHSVLVPKEGPAALGDGVVVSSTATIEGKLWQPGCFVNQKMRLKPGAIRMKAVLEGLLGKSAGEETTFVSIMEPTYGPEFSGKELKGTLKLVQVYTVQEPELNNDLAIDAGYDNLNQMKSNIQRETENQVTQMREQQAWNTLLAKLMQRAKVSPLPEPWIVDKAEEAYAAQRQRYRTESEYLASSGAKSKEQLIASYRDQLRVENVQNLVVRKYAFESKLLEPSRLANLYNVVSDARVRILRRMKIDIPGEEGEE